MKQKIQLWQYAAFVCLNLTIFALAISGQSVFRSANLKENNIAAPASLVGITARDFSPLTDLPDSPNDLVPSWNPATVTPTTISRYGFVDAGEDFYVLGGVSGGTRVSTVFRYNTGTAAWTTLAPIPGSASEAPCAALLNNKIYLAQGDTGNNFFIYDIVGNSWTTGPAVPVLTNRYGCAAAAFGTSVYIVGGSAAISNSVQVYNTTTNTWATGAAAPNAFILAGYTQIGQYLYVVGGFGTAAPTTNLNATSRLDMIAGTWLAGPTFTPARADFALANLGNQLYAIGGDTTGGTFFNSSTAVDQLDLRAFPAGTWVASPNNLPSIRQANQGGFNSLVPLVGSIWSTGGLDGTTFAFLNEHLFRQALSVSAARCEVSGQVTDSAGAAISRALVSYIDENGNLRSTRTNNFGNFTFSEVNAGQTYVFNVSAKSYVFAPQVLTVNESIAGLNFVGQ
jgi:hypothetical protein